MSTNSRIERLEAYLSLAQVIGGAAAILTILIFVYNSGMADAKNSQRLDDLNAALNHSYGCYLKVSEEKK